MAVLQRSLALLDEQARLIKLSMFVVISITVLMQKIIQTLIFINHQVHHTRKLSID